MKRLLILCFLAGFPLMSWGQTTVDTLPKNFYKHFTGTLGEKPVVAVIYAIDGTIQGHYSMGNNGPEIALIYLEEKSKANRIVFAENGIPGEKIDHFPVWQCHFSDGMVTGVWYSKGKEKQEPIRLQENYPAGVNRFTLRTEHTHQKVYPNQKTSAHYDLVLSYPVALEASSSTDWINTEIKNVLKFPPDQSFKTGALQWEKRYKKKFTSHLKNLNSENSPQAYDRNILQLSVVYNQGGYLQLSAFHQEVEGTAQGDYRIKNYCFDVKNRKRLTLSDITTLATKKLGVLIKQQFRKQYDSASGTPSKVLLNSDTLLPNTNFGIDHTGIYFVYNDIAPSHYGSVYVHIPYKALAGTLVTDFKKRMHIK